MTNAELIAELRGHILSVPLTLLHDAADALEAAEQRIARLEEDLKTREAEREVMQDTIKVCEKRIAELERNFSDVCNANGSLVPAWISVEERLPEESGEYIVYIQMGTGVEVPDFLGSNDLSYVTSVYFKKRQKLWLDEYDESYNADLSLVDTANDYHVTHWMKLPEPPNCGARMRGEHDGC